MPTGFSPGQIFFGESFVDDGDFGARGGVGFRKFAALDDRSAGGAEIVGLDFVVERGFGFCFVVDDLAFRENVEERAVVAHGDVATNGGVANSGKGANALGELLVELLAALFVIALETEVHSHHEGVIGAKTHVDLSRVLQATHEETSAGQKKQTHGDLRDDESIAKTMMSRGGATGAAAGFESVGEIGARSFDRGKQASDHAGDERGEEAEAEDAPVHAQIKEAQGNVGRDVNGHEREGGPTGKNEAEDSSEGREQDCFC